MSCCTELSPGDSPFTRVVVYAWHDGPARGLMACGGCTRVWRFDALAELADDSGGSDVRVLRLAPAADGAIDTAVALMEYYEEPVWPVWTPLVRGPILDQCGAPLDTLAEPTGAAQFVAGLVGWSRVYAVKKPPAKDPKDWMEYVGWPDEE